MSVFGYLAKLKSSLGLPMNNVSMSHLISFSSYQTKCVLIWTVDDIINFKIFLGSTSKAMTDREKKRE